MIQYQELDLYYFSKGKKKVASNFIGFLEIILPFHLENSILDLRASNKKTFL